MEAKVMSDEEIEEFMLKLYNNPLLLVKLTTALSNFFRNEGKQEGFDKVVEWLNNRRNKADTFHYQCWASGIVRVINEWGNEPKFKCPYYTRDFNCGYRDCKTGIIFGVKERTERQTVENHLLDEIEAFLKERLDEKNNIQD